MEIQKVITPDKYVKVRPKIKNVNYTNILAQYLPYWQNNSLQYSGFIRFCFDLFSGKLIDPRYGIPRWLESARRVIFRYYPGMYKMDRCNAICTYRDGAKTTYIQLLVLYFILLSDYGIYWENNCLPIVDFIRYRAKSFDEAEKKTDTIKWYLGDKDVEEVFGEIRPTFGKGLVKGTKDNIKLLITNTNKILIPFGIEQPARGHNIRGKRPQLDIADDVENTQNTKTPISREYNWTEVMAEQLGGLDAEGMFVFIFNYVHEQGIGPTLVKAAKLSKTNWNVIVRKLAYEKIDDKGNITVIPDWSERFPVDYIKKLEQSYQAKPSDYRLYRREYFNEILSDEEYQIIFYDGYYERLEGHNWLNVTTPTGEIVKEVVNVYVSADPAISEDKKSSDGVVAVTMVNSQGKRRVYDLSVRKFDIRDRYYDESKRPSILATTPEELANVRVRGMVEEIVRKAIYYNADMIIIEKAGQQGAWFNDVLELIKRLGIRTKVASYHPKDEKIYKLKTGLMNQFAAGNYEISTKLPYLERLIQGIKTFPQELDIFDALHNVEPFIRTPNKLHYTPSKGIYEVREENRRDTHPETALTNPRKYLGEVEPFLLI